MDGEELHWVLRGREDRAERERELVAWVVTEVRNLRGVMWASDPGPMWTVRQTLGLDPRSPERAQAGNLIAVVDAAIAAAAERRDQADRDQADGWFESLELAFTETEIPVLEEPS